MSGLKVTILGLSITSSWGNGHATNYRALVRALCERGHDVWFLERDQPWYAAARDMPEPPYGRTELYGSRDDLVDRFGNLIETSDAVVVGSYVPEGADVGRWVSSAASGVTAFYDIDTPVTLASLDRDDCAYLDRETVGRFDLYLSFTGGPILEVLENRYGARRAIAFYCMVDEDSYKPVEVERRWDLGYLGTYAPDRQNALERLLVEPARRRPDLRFVVAGPQFPADVSWPPNVERIEHCAPEQHAAFYCAQRFTLNVTRAEMVRRGWSPSVRLFEAAACGVPVVSDRWEGIESLFVPGREILLADTADDVLAALDSSGDAVPRAMGAAARRRVLAEHTAGRRAAQLERLVASVATECVR